MPGGIGKASLPMNSPRRFVIRGRLYGRCAGCASAIDEPIRLIDEYLDPRGGQSDVDRARLDLAAWHGLVNEERGAIDMKPGNAAEVPKLGRAERRLVPSDCRGSVRDNQHHRNERPVAFASHQSHPSDTLSLAQHDGPSSRGTRLVGGAPAEPGSQCGDALVGQRCAVDGASPATARPRASSNRASVSRRSSAWSTTGSG